MCAYDLLCVSHVCVCVCMKSYRGCSMSVLSSMMSSQPFTVIVKLKTLTHMQSRHTHTHTHTHTDEYAHRRTHKLSHSTSLCRTLNLETFSRNCLIPSPTHKETVLMFFPFFLYLLLSAKCIHASQRLLATFSAALDWLTEVGLWGNSSPLAGALPGEISSSTSSSQSRRLFITPLPLSLPLAICCLLSFVHHSLSFYLQCFRPLSESDQLKIKDASISTAKRARAHTHTHTHNETHIHAEVHMQKPKCTHPHTPRETLHNYG